MAGLLQSPELWIGLGLVLLVVMLLGGGSAEKKKQKARLARVTRHGPRVVQTTQDKLRKRDPNEGSALGKRLAEFSAMETLQGRLETAGMNTALKPLLMRSLMITLGFVFLFLFLGKPLILALLIGLVAGLGVPHMLISRRIRKRQLKFLKLFPEAIELIVRGLRAGLPVAESFTVVAKEVPEPVGNLFATISQQTALGVPMERALADAAKKLDLTEFNFFVTTIILQRETGGNLGEILSNLAEVLRQRQMMKLKIGALSSEARASAYIIGSLPFFVFGVLNVVSPQYLDLFYNDYRGNMSMLAAAGMMFTGAFVMKRMTMLEI